MCRLSAPPLRSSRNIRSTVVDARPIPCAAGADGGGWDLACGPGSFRGRRFFAGTIRWGSTKHSKHSKCTKDRRNSATRWTSSSPPRIRVHSRPSWTTPLHLSGWVDDRAGTQRAGLPIAGPRFPFRLQDILPLRSWALLREVRLRSDGRVSTSPKGPAPRTAPVLRRTPHGGPAGGGYRGAMETRKSPDLKKNASLREPPRHEKEPPLPSRCLGRHRCLEARPDPV